MSTVIQTVNDRAVITFPTGVNEIRQRISARHRFPLSIVFDYQGRAQHVLALDIGICPQGVAFFDVEVYRRTKLGKQEMQLGYWASPANPKATGTMMYTATWRAYIPVPQFVARAAYDEFNQHLHPIIAELQEAVLATKGIEWLYHVCDPNHERSELEQGFFDDVSETLNKVFNLFASFNFMRLGENVTFLEASKYFEALAPVFFNESFCQLDDDGGEDGACHMMFDNAPNLKVSVIEERHKFKFSDGKHKYYGTFKIEPDLDSIYLQLQDHAYLNGFFLTGFKRGFDEVISPLFRFVEYNSLQEQIVYDNCVAHEAELLAEMQSSMIEDKSKDGGEPQPQPQPKDLDIEDADIVEPNSIVKILNLAVPTEVKMGRVLLPYTNPTPTKGKPRAATRRKTAAKKASKRTSKK